MIYAIFSRKNVTIDMSFVWRYFGPKSVFVEKKCFSEVCRLSRENIKITNKRERLEKRGTHLRCLVHPLCQSRGMPTRRLCTGFQPFHFQLRSISCLTSIFMLIVEVDLEVNVNCRYSTFNRNDVLFIFVFVFDIQL